MSSLADRDATSGPGPLFDYLEAIGKEPLLTKEDEAELALAMENGHEAQDLLDSGKKLSAERRRELRMAVERGARARRAVHVARACPAGRADCSREVAGRRAAQRLIPYAFPSPSVARFVNNRSRGINGYRFAMPREGGERWPT